MHRTWVHFLCRSSSPAQLLSRAKETFDTDPGHPDKAIEMAEIFTGSRHLTPLWEFMFKIHLSYWYAWKYDEKDKLHANQLLLQCETLLHSAEVENAAHEFHAQITFLFVKARVTMVQMVQRDYRAVLDILQSTDDLRVDCSADLLECSRIRARIDDFKSEMLALLGEEEKALAVLNTCVAALSCPKLQKDKQIRMSLGYMHMNISANLTNRESQHSGSLGDSRTHIRRALHHLEICKDLLLKNRCYSNLLEIHIYSQRGINSALADPIILEYIQKMQTNLNKCGKIMLDGTKQRTIVNTGYVGYYLSLTRSWSTVGYKMLNDALDKMSRLPVTRHSASTVKMVLLKLDADILRENFEDVEHVHGRFSSVVENEKTLDIHKDLFRLFWMMAKMRSVRHLLDGRVLCEAEQILVKLSRYKRPLADKWLYKGTQLLKECTSDDHFAKFLRTIELNASIKLETEFFTQLQASRTLKVTSVATHPAFDTNRKYNGACLYIENTAFKNLQHLPECSLNAERIENLCKFKFGFKAQHVRSRMNLRADQIEGFLKTSLQQDCSSLADFNFLLIVILSHGKSGENGSLEIAGIDAHDSPCSNVGFISDAGIERMVHSCQNSLESDLPVILILDVCRGDECIELPVPTGDAPVMASHSYPAIRNPGDDDLAEGEMMEAEGTENTILHHSGSQSMIQIPVTNCDRPIALTIPRKRADILKIYASEPGTVSTIADDESSPILAAFCAAFEGDGPWKMEDVMASINARMNEWHLLLDVSDGMPKMRRQQCQFLHTLTKVFKISNKYDHQY